MGKYNDFPSQTPQVRPKSAFYTVHRFHRRLKHVTRFHQCNSHHVLSYTDNVIGNFVLTYDTTNTQSDRRFAELERIFYLRYQFISPLTLVYTLTIFPTYRVLRFQFVNLKFKNLHLEIPFIFRLVQKHQSHFILLWAERKK